MSPYIGGPCPLFQVVVKSTQDSDEPFLWLAFGISYGIIENYHIRENENENENVDS